MQKCLLGLCLLFSFQSFANDKAVQAEQSYSLRDFNDEGVENVKVAIALYTEAVAVEADPVLAIGYRNSIASAQYFIGTALSDEEKNNQAKLETFTQSIVTADAIITELGADVKTVHNLKQADVNALLANLNDAQESELAAALYTRGISLAQWMRLKGIGEVGKRDVVFGIMETIRLMGKSSIHSYGPNRTIARMKFVLPTIVGGDNAESLKKLNEAIKNTKAEGKDYSVHGFNNIYFAQSLYKSGKETRAKEFLQLFVDGDFNLLLVGYEPENREALRVAQGLLDGSIDWE